MELIINKEKFDIFLDVARALNKYGITPILFGSLGLNRLIGEFGEAQDIDILVPDAFYNDKWQTIIEIMKELNFKLHNKDEGEFIRDNNLAAFASENDLTEFTKANSDDLKVTELDGVRFKELTPEQYLLCYQLMLRDNYRQEKRGNADKEKIELIHKYLADKN